MPAVITAKEAAERRGISLRRIQALCRQRRIPGARYVGRVWYLPDPFTIIPGKRGPSLRSKP